MKFRAFLLVVFAFLTTSILTAELAKIIRLTGTQDVLVTLPDGSEVPGVVGLEMPVDSLIEVRAGTKLFFKTFEGQITVVEANSVVFLETIEVTPDAREKTVIALRQGDLVANLDPNKRGTNDYGVRTPKGVAAARGTNYSVSVNGITVLVTVSAGQVSFSVPDFPAPIILVPGQASGASSQQASSLAAVLSDPATAAIARIALQATASAVATLAADPTSGVTAETVSQVVTTAGNAGKANGDNSVVTAVAAAAAAANPDMAETVVRAAVASDPSAASDVVTSVTNSVTQANAASTTETTVSGSLTTTTTTKATPTAAVVAATAQSLARVANAAAQSVGSTQTVDATVVTETVQTSQAAAIPVITSTTSATPTTTGTPTPTATETVEPTSEDVVEIEVPSENTIVTVFATFTIRLSGGRLVAVTVNDQNNTVNVRAVTSVQGTQTAEVGDGGSTSFTVPASVTTVVGALTAEQFTAIAAGIRTALPGPIITVPGNAIIVSPSS